MKPKSRLLRILLVLLLLGAFVGYFAFQTFLYPPLEGRYKPDLATLIPRDVDFYVSKAGLADLFDGFPRLAAGKAIEATEAYETWTASPEYQEFVREVKLEETLQAMRDLQGSIPLGMELPQILGGEDVAIAGWFRGPNLEQADWALYARANWAGKLGVSALKHPGVLGLEGRGLRVVRDGARIELSGNGVPRPLHLTRIRDVVVCATTKEAVEAAIDLQQRKGVDSLFQSALYFDHIHNHPGRPAAKDDLEFSFDLRSYLEATRQSGAWPKANAQDVVPRLLARYFQLNSIKQVVGLVDTAGGVSADVYGEFSSELISPNQNRFYRTRGFDRAQIDEVARLAPDDTAIFVYLQGSVGDLLMQVVDSLAPDERNLIDDAIKQTREFDGLPAVVDALGTSLRNRLALVVRKNDYPPDPNGAPHNGEPVPALALIAWMENEQKIIELRDAIGLRGYEAFGMRGRNPGDKGYYAHSVGGFETREFWSEFVPGTGCVATMNASDVFVVTNQPLMLGHIAKTYLAAERPPLAQRDDFSALCQSALPRANVLVWIDPQRLTSIMRERAQDWARNNIPEPVWVEERRRIEREILAAEHGGRARSTLDANAETALENEIDRRVDELAQQRFQEHFPALMAKSERLFTYVEASTAMLAMLSLDPKFFELAVRVVTPLPRE